MILDPIRLRLLKLIDTRDSDLKKVSLAIGKNAAYVHQFIYRGTPKVLPEDVRQALMPLADRLKKVKPAEFATSVRAWNTRKLTELELAVSQKPDSMAEKCIFRKFALAVSSLPWILAALRK